MKDKRYKLTKADIKELKRLRKDNPGFWSYAQLAYKFGCSSANVCYHVTNRSEKIKAYRAERCKAN